VSLNGDLVKKLSARARDEGIPLNELVTDLLRKGLAK
jgi:hypothetical protein